jgi:hypothetical protein
MSLPWTMKDDVFGDVGGVVANAFHVFGQQDQVHELGGMGRVFLDQINQAGDRLGLEFVLFLVLGEDALGQLHVAPGESVEGLAQHLLGDLRHAEDQAHLGHGRFLEEVVVAGL